MNNPPNIDGLIPVTVECDETSDWPKYQEAIDDFQEATRPTGKEVV